MALRGAVICYLEGLTNIAARPKLRRLVQWQGSDGSPELSLLEV